MEEIRKGARQSMEKTTQVKYNLACGNDYREGYINVDNGSMLGNKFDVYSDIFEFRINRNSADEILLSHFMMYLIPENALRLFERWYFGLKKGGCLVIETQDLKKLAKIITKSNSSAEINSQVVQFYGAGKTKGHYWTWCEDTLIPLLKYVGFKDFEIEDGGYHGRSDRDLTIIATK